MKTKISILIPFYNGGELFEKTIQSILDQSLDDYEVICVDDFSNDENKSLLKKWCEKDTRIKSVHRDVKGGTAIKGIVYGLPFCNGEYLLYMSQDDLLGEDCLKQLYEKAIKYDADIVIPDMYWYFEDGKEHGAVKAYKNNYENSISGKEAFLRSLDWEIHGFALKKMSYVKKIGYDDFLFNSDEYADRMHYFFTDKIWFSSAKFMYRQDNENAVTHKGIRPLYKIEYGNTNLRLLEFIYKQEISCPKEEYSLFKSCCSTYWRCHNRNFIKAIKDDEKEKCLIRLRELKEGLVGYAKKRKKFVFRVFCVILDIKGMIDNV